MGNESSTFDCHALDDRPARRRAEDHEREVKRFLRNGYSMSVDKGFVVFSKGPGRQ